MQSLHRFAYVVAANGGGDDALYIGDVEPIASRAIAIDFHVDVAPPGQTFRKHGRDTGDFFRDTLDLLRHAVYGGEIAARYLHTDWALDAGGEHVDAVADRRYPNVGKSRQLDGLIQLFDQFLGGHTGAPLIARFKLDGRFHHLHRRGVGCGFRPSDFAEDAGNFGHLLDEFVGLLQDLGCFAGGQPGQRGRHV